MTYAESFKIRTQCEHSIANGFMHATDGLGYQYPLKELAELMARLEQNYLGLDKAKIVLKRKKR